MKKVAIVLVGLMTLAVNSHAEIIRWGGAGGKTDITTNTTLLFTSAGRSSTFNTATSAVATATGTSNYYPNPSGYSPYFSAAGSTNIYMGRIESSATGDRISQFGNSIAAGSRFQSMVLWDVLTENSPFAFTNINMEVSTRSASGITTIQLVVEQDHLYYISDIIGGSGTNYTSINIADASTLGWYEFTPFVSGVATIGNSVDVGVVLNGLTGIGYYADSINGGATSIATGTNVRYFEASVQAVPEPATALLLAIGGGLTWLMRFKQWS